EPEDTQAHARQVGDRQVARQVQSRGQEAREGDPQGGAAQAGFLKRRCTMSLTDYRRKRSFDKTREPEPGKPGPRGKRAIFVVQLHHASRRHYDFRLQVGDALKSWAVPK